MLKKGSVLGGLDPSSVERVFPEFPPLSCVRHVGHWMKSWSDLRSFLCFHFICRNGNIYVFGKQDTSQ